MHPIFWQLSGSLHGKLTTVVGRLAAVHPQGFVTDTVSVHCGTKQERQAVAVDVKVGQTADAEHWETVLVSSETDTCVTVVVAGFARDVTVTVAVRVVTGPGTSRTTVETGPATSRKTVERAVTVCVCRTVAVVVVREIAVVVTTEMAVVVETETAVVVDVTTTVSV